MDDEPDLTPQDLRGFTVGTTADRRGEEQAVMLRRLGVAVIAGPAMQTLAVPDGGESLRHQVEALVAAPPDYLVANTGIGVRNLFTMAAEWALDTDLRQALAQVKVVARGPKAAGALRLAGVDVWWRAPGEQLTQVLDHLLAQGMAGASVVFQLHGDDRQGFVAALSEAGASVTALEVYRWSLPADLSAARALVEACCAGEVDALTFTAAPAVRNLVDVADSDGRAGALVDVLNREMVVGCVGPVCAAAALEEGLVAPVVPEHWRLGSLVKAVGVALEGRTRHLVVAAGDRGPGGEIAVIVQGSLVTVNGVEAQLASPQRRLARILAERPGEWFDRAELASRLSAPSAAPGEIDQTVAALRLCLGPAATSVVESRKGYRWNAVQVADARSFLQ